MCACFAHLRDRSSSLAACAALSSPVGSKLLHLSLGLSPPVPPEPAAGGGGGGGGNGTSGLAPPPCPLFRPKSHDMFQVLIILTVRSVFPSPRCDTAPDTSSFTSTRVSRRCCVRMRHVRSPAYEQRGPTVIGCTGDGLTKCESLYHPPVFRQSPPS